MHVAISSDERTPFVEVLVEHVRALGQEPCVLAVGEPWPDVARAVAGAVAEGSAERGVVCCWTGTGVSIAANKIAGVRAALCGDVETARCARAWNDANVLALSLRRTTAPLAGELLAAFLSSEPDPSEADNINALENERR